MRIPMRKRRITGSADVAPVFREILRAASEEDRDKEHFWVACLNTKNTILRIELITLGLLDQTLVHPREVFRPAIACSAKSLILAHNHPSGDPTPSEKDADLTRRLIEVGKLLDIRILDHVIVVNEDSDWYWSFQEHTELWEIGHDLPW